MFEENGDKKIGNVRRPGDGVEAVLARGDASVDEVRRRLPPPPN